MALTKLTTNVENVQALSDTPNATEGLTSAQLKEVFDKAGVDIKTYINDTLTAQVDTGLGEKVAKASNLSDLANAATARTNLGLGTMAVETATNYLTKAGNLSGLASTSTSRTNLGLGTMATETASNYLTKADNLSGLANTSTARTNLGLGTMATATATNYLAKSENLSGLANTTTARTNLGLGNAATRNITASTSDPTGGNDGDIWIKYS